MPYIDVAVMPVPNANRTAYEEMSKQWAAACRDHGALEVVECWGDNIPEGELTSFPMAVKCSDDETVAVSFVTWPTRAARDAGNEKVMADPRMQMGPGAPFDGRRLIFGGFEVISKG